SARSAARRRGVALAATGPRGMTLAFCASTWAGPTGASIVTVKTNRASQNRTRKPNGMKDLRDAARMDVFEVAGEREIPANYPGRAEVRRGPARHIRLGPIA